MIVVKPDEDRYLIACSTTEYKQLLALVWTAEIILDKGDNWWTYHKMLKDMTPCVASTAKSQ